MTEREKMPTIIRSRYWKSYKVHRCDCSERNVSLGEKEVWSEAIEEAGETRLRNLDRNLRRMRCGMSSLNERHGTTGIWTLANWLCGRSFHDGIDMEGFMTSAL